MNEDEAYRALSNAHSALIDLGFIRDTDVVEISGREIHVYRVKENENEKDSVGTLN